jgi:Fic/DOC family protein
MQRGATERFHNTSTAGETVRALIPDPLPPAPPVVLDGALQVLLEQALLSLGRLDSITTLLPDPDFFLYSYIRKEAVLSSQVEGTQSSISDLLLYEIKAAPGAPPSATTLPPWSRLTAEPDLWLRSVSENPGGGHRPDRRASRRSRAERVSRKYFRDCNYFA